jgi:hypothetical protein
MTLPDLDSRLKRAGHLQVPEKNLQGSGTNIWLPRFAIVPAETPPPVQTAGDTIPKAPIPPDGGLEIWVLGNVAVRAAFSTTQTPPNTWQCGHQRKAPRSLLTSPVVTDDRTSSASTSGS